MDDVKCSKCGGATAGFKCDQCGAEAVAHDDKHGCGPEHCVAKCSNCQQAQTKCAC